MDSCLTRRDWAQVEGEYQASSPYNYAVLDDFFAYEPSYFGGVFVGAGK